MMRFISLVAFMAAGLSPAFANNLFISSVVYNSSANTLNFDVAWDNGFRITNGSKDFAYLFVKYKNSNDPNWYTMAFPNSGHSLNVPEGEASIQYATTSGITSNGERLAMRLDHGVLFTSGPVDVNATIKLSAFVTLINPSFKVFGIEMVSPVSNTLIPYYIGDGASVNRFHRGDNVNVPFLTDGTNSPIAVGTNADEINTTSASPLPVTSIPFQYFRTGKSVMRYEITQQQYVDFLNCLSRTAQNTRTGTDISGTNVTKRYVMSNSSVLQHRNGIRCDSILPSGGPITFYCDLDGDGVPNESFDGQNISANYLLPADLMAYLDWAGLHPMTEMNYEFFSRGTAMPVPGEYAWGSTMKTAASLNIAASGGANETPTNIGADGLFRRSADPMRTGAAATPTSNRSQAGASFSGVMDLSGNAAELVIGSYSASDFPLTSSFGKGDGILDLFGNANQNWPTQLVAKGLSVGSNSLHTVSQRGSGASPYVSNTVRSEYYGGRGVL